MKRDMLYFISKFPRADYKYINFVSVMLDRLDTPRRYCIVNVIDSALPLFLMSKFEKVVVINNPVLYEDLSLYSDILDELNINKSKIKVVFSEKIPVTGNLKLDYVFQDSISNNRTNVSNLLSIGGYLFEKGLEYRYSHNFKGDSGFVPVNPLSYFDLPHTPEYISLHKEFGFIYQLCNQYVNESLT